MERKLNLILLAFCVILVGFAFASSLMLDDAAKKQSALEETIEVITP